MKPPRRRESGTAVRYFQNVRQPESSPNFSLSANDFAIALLASRFRLSPSMSRLVCELAKLREMRDEARAVPEPSRARENVA